ncbi:MAG TPA: hypothetical protein VMV58_01045 [Desulfosporosinus sp.]|nr:hypothetical protein [Desulfosporosinus sp.]
MTVKTQKPITFYGGGGVGGKFTFASESMYGRGKESSRRLHGIIYLEKPGSSSSPAGGDRVVFDKFINRGDGTVGQGSGLGKKPKCEIRQMHDAGSPSPVFLREE